MEAWSFYLKSWEEFEERLIGVKRDYGELAPSTAPLLFRGHGCAGWQLDTTLQRRTVSRVTWAEYTSLLRGTLPSVQTLTGREWNPPSYEILAKWGSEYDQGHSAPPGYDYYVYLRHHSFPSPLLDWSRSAYVAAFFAFRAPTSEQVAIYCYLDNIGRGKVGSSNQPRILHLGPYVKAHPRHVLQQSEYTICSLFDGTNNQWEYAAREDVFKLSRTDQDLLWKFSLPASERLKVLKRLDEYNLNAHSLFSTEEALLETVGLREMEFRHLLEKH